MQNPGFNGFDNNPKPLQRLNIVIVWNNPLKSGVTDTDELRGHGSRREV
jgi:hypothetical protein